MTIDLKQCAAWAGAIYNPASKWDWEFNHTDIRVGVHRMDDGAWAVVPRGTVPTDVRDLERDADFVPCDGYALGWLHNGFYQGALAFAGAVDQVVGADTVRVIGHSLAAAMGLIYGCMRVIDLKPVDWAVTFGCPKLAFSPFGRKTKIEAIAVRFGGSDIMHVHDPVTKAPACFNHARPGLVLDTTIATDPVLHALDYHAIAGYEADCPS